MKEFKAYLFDFDGTLFDTLDSLVYVYDAAMKVFGFHCNKALAAHFMHMSLRDTCKELGITKEEDVLRFFALIAQALDYPENVERIRCYDDVRPTLDALREQGKALGIVSGNTVPHIHLVLEKTGLSSYFPFVVGSSPERKPKPSGDPIFYARSFLGNLSPEEILYVGDSLQDPETAINGGVVPLLLDRNNEYRDYPGNKIARLSELLVK